MTKNIDKNSPKVLGLDVSTKTIGWALFDIQTKDVITSYSIHYTKLYDTDGRKRRDPADDI